MKRNMKNFSNEDLKAGMLVILKNGIAGILIPVMDELEVYSKDLDAETEAYLYSSELEKGSPDERYAIVKVYGLSKNYSLFDIFTRNLLWEYKYEPKELTIEEVEKLLGYSIKIVSSKEDK